MGRSDRRYCCIETSSRYKGNFDYFETLLSYCNQESADHFYTYICKLEKTRNIKNIPMTTLKSEMMESAKSSIERFYDDITQTDFSEVKMDYTDIEYKWDVYIIRHYDSSKKYIMARNLYSVYKLWCKEKNDKIKTETAFGREMKQLLTAERLTIGIVYSISLIGL
jgi:hypothetical protein